MNDKINLNQFVITIKEKLPGRFFAHSIFDNEKSGQILMQLAIFFLNQAAIKKHEELKAKQGAIINPHTMMTMPDNNNNSAT
jgi:hypothetical protein